MADVNPLTAPTTPAHYTLLLKHHKSTVLLSALPSTPLTILRTLLLAALTSRNITSLKSRSGKKAVEVLLPTDPEELELGILVDRRDPSKGWQLVREDAEPTKDEGKGKGKAKGRKSDGGGTGKVTNGTVEAAGMSDGCWVAYRVRQSGSKQDEEGDVVIDMEADQGWDVVVPSFEEADAAWEENKDEGEGEEDIVVPQVHMVR